MLDPKQELEKDLKRWTKLCNGEIKKHSKAGDSPACLVCGLTAAQKTARALPAGSLVCSFFLQGKCKRGAKCKFMHEEKDGAKDVSSSEKQGDGECGTGEDGGLLWCEGCASVGFCSEECAKKVTESADIEGADGESEGEDVVRPTHGEFECQQLQLFTMAKEIIDKAHT